MRLTKVEKVSGLADGLAFIFDLDGVIVDSNPVHEEAWRRYMRRFGTDLDAAAIGRMFGRRNDEIVRDFFAGAPLSPEQVYAHGAAKEMLYREMMRSQLDRRLVPGIREFLDRHKAAPIALATNGEPANVAFVLEESGLRGYFRVVVDGHQVERPKPDPEIYLLAARLLDVLPQNCIIFEDSEWGLEAARAAGARVVAVTTTHSSLDHANLDIDNFRNGDLEPWLNEQTPVG
jgi:beta-phosphoglucomutase family hydrolase